MPKDLDLEKYAGTWYEILRTENNFENKTMRNIKAVYEYRNGRLFLTNSYTFDAFRFSVSGVATKTRHRNVLSVEFFIPFQHNESFYHVAFIDENYRIAIVHGYGNGKPCYWLLSRYPKVQESLINTAKSYITRMAKKEHIKPTFYETAQD